MPPRHVLVLLGLCACASTSLAFTPQYDEVAQAARVTAQAQAAAAQMSGEEAHRARLGDFEFKGDEWTSYREGKEGLRYYHNKRTGETQWNDPRVPDNGVDANMHDYLNRVRQDKLLERELESNKALAKPPKASLASQLTIVFLPFLLFFGAIGGRVYYLQRYYPEMLWPSKKRKERKKGWGTSKYKTGGKMSQDGKGGRSANS